MTLPRLSGSVFVLLSEDNTTPTSVRSPGTPLASLVLTGGPPVLTQLQQPDFYASQFWYQGYPDEVITTINAPDAPREDSVTIEGFANTALTIANTFPNFVTAYDPTPAPGPAEPVPNPNGSTSNNSSQASKTWPLPIPPALVYRHGLRFASDVAWAGERPFSGFIDGLFCRSF